MRESRTSGSQGSRLQPALPASAGAGAALLLALLLLCALLAFVRPNAAFASEGEAAQPQGEVLVSAEGHAAVPQGAGFALSDFRRAQTGTSAKVDGAYHGYHFLAGGDPNVVSMVAMEGLVVVHVPQRAASAFGLDLQDEGDLAALKDALVALDAQNANGGVLVSADDEWLFTGEDRIAANGLSIGFARELKDGFFYVTLEGEGGGDAGDRDNPLYDGITHACFAGLGDASQTAIAQPPTALERFAGFLSTVNLSPLWVTLKTSVTAIAIVFVLGLAAAYWSLRCSPRVRDAADAVFTIPMVLPPTVCGFLLLLLLGKNTALGAWFIDVGFPLVFSWAATVIAAVVVSFPLMYRSARGAFEGLDPNMLDAARTLGWGNARIFFRLMLPLSWNSIAAGTVLAFARALGEFGATLFLAGNYLGVTRTVPIAIYFEWMNGNTGVALFWTAVILVFSFAVILLINLWGRRTLRYRKGEVRR